MSGQAVVVFALVAISALYATWKLMPGAWRSRLVQRALRLTANRGGVYAFFHRRLLRLEKTATGGCDRCAAGKIIHPKHRGL